MSSHKLAALVFMLALTISLAAADEVRHHEIDASRIERLTLDVRSGHLSLAHHNIDSIIVEMRISADDDNWFRRHPKVSDMDLSSQVEDNEVTLSFNEKGVSTEWVVLLPSVSKLDVNLGAGAIEMHNLVSDIVMNIGVGAVEMNLQSGSYGEIVLSTGIGDTSISGARNIESHRALISSNIKANGNGEHTIDVNLGVGTASVALTHAATANR